MCYFGDSRSQIIFQYSIETKKNYSTRNMYSSIEENDSLASYIQRLPQWQYQPDNSYSHIISYHVISYHIISYNIGSYHIVSIKPLLMIARNFHVVQSFIISLSAQILLIHLSLLLSPLLPLSSSPRSYTKK